MYILSNYKFGYIVIVDTEIYLIEKRGKNITSFKLKAEMLNFHEYNKYYKYINSKWICPSPDRCLYDQCPHSKCPIEPF